MRNMLNANLKAVIVALALSTVVACGSSGTNENAVPDGQIIKPASGNKSWETTNVNGVKISVPSEWETTGPSPLVDDAVGYQFQTAVNDFGTRGFAQVTVLPKLKTHAKELVKTIANQVRAVVGAKNSKKTHIVWPGAKDAWYLSYVAYPPNKDKKTAPHPSQVIVADLEGGGQTQVTVSALKKDFRSEHIREVLQTLKISESAGEK